MTTLYVGATVPPPVEEDLAYCGHCNDFTPQTAGDSGHERDGSHDGQACHRCGWRYWGYSGKWEPPSQLTMDQCAARQIEDCNVEPR